MKDNPREKLKRAKLVAITAQPKPGKTYLEMVKAALMGGAEVIQLREKQLSSKEFLFLAKSLKELCHLYGALFIVNDRLDLALASGADGAHLGQEDCPLPDARKIVNQFYGSSYLKEEVPFLLGCSTHSLEQALKAEEEGADYLGCGPIFATPTKPDLAAVGLELIKEYRKRIHIPFFAIGGIDPTNIEQVLKAGAKAIAVVRAVFASEDIQGSVHSLRETIGRYA